MLRISFCLCPSLSVPDCLIVCVDTAPFFVLETLERLLRDVQRGTGLAMTSAVKIVFLFGFVGVFGGKREKLAYLCARVRTFTCGCV